MGGELILTKLALHELVQCSLNKNMMSTVHVHHSRLELKLCLIVSHSSVVRATGIWSLFQIPSKAKFFLSSCQAEHAIFWILNLVKCSWFHEKKLSSWERELQIFRYWQTVTYPLTVVQWVSFQLRLLVWHQPCFGSLSRTTSEPLQVHTHKQMKISV